jgi:spermidine synthase
VARVLWLLPVSLLVGSNVVFETSSKLNSKIVVRDEGERRSLLLDGVLQTAIDKRDPTALVLDYTQAAMAGLLFVEPRRVLVIGLGGGAMPTFIRSRWPAALIDVVEIDPVVADVARRFFRFRPDARMRLIIADGAAVVGRAGAPYDLILLDAYAPDVIPEALATEAFFSQARRRLTAEGALAVNVWSPPNPQHRAILDRLRLAFEEVHLVSTSDRANDIFIALPRRTGLDRAGLTERARRLERERNLGFSLSALIADSWKLAPPARAERRVH